MKNKWNGWLVKFGAVVSVSFLMGCGQLTAKVVEIAGNDLQRTSEMAAKYGKPGVKQCVDFMLVQVGKLQQADSQLAALRDEPTAGLFSAALKAALVAEALKALETANGPEFKAQFKQACSEVAGDVLFNVMADAVKIGKR